MQFKKLFNRELLALIASISMLASVYFVNKYDVKQLYREFATLSLTVAAQEKQIESLAGEVSKYQDLYSSLQIELDEHNEKRGKENMELYARLRELELELLNLSTEMANRKPDTVFSNISGNDRFEFVDKQVSRIGQYETKGQALVAWKDDYLTTKKVNVNTIGEIILSPKIKKVDKDEFYSYIDETFVGGITIRGQGEIQRIPPPRNQLSLGPFIGIAYNNTTGLTEPIIGIGVTYNMIKLWDWR